MSEKKGLLGGLSLENLKHEFFEDDGKSKPSTPAPPPPAPPVSIAQPPMPPSTGTMPYTFGTSPVSSLPGAGAPEPIDEATLAVVNNGVFDPNQPSHYTQFINVWTAMNRTSDVASVIRTMQAMDKTLTAPVILGDISTHLSRLDAVLQSAESEFTKAAQEKLGSADATLAQLNQQNEQAQAEIARHQKETGERMTQIATVTQQRAADDAAIARAKARTEAAAASIKQQLVSMQAMLSSLPA